MCFFGIDFNWICCVVDSFCDCVEFFFFYFEIYNLDEFRFVDKNSWNRLFLFILVICVLYLRYDCYIIRELNNSEGIIYCWFFLYVILIVF